MRVSPVEDVILVAYRAPELVRHAEHAFHVPAARLAEASPQRLAGPLPTGDGVEENPSGVRGAQVGLGILAVLGPPGQGFQIGRSRPGEGWIAEPLGRPTQAENPLFQGPEHPDRPGIIGNAGNDDVGNREACQRQGIGQPVPTR